MSDVFYPMRHYGRRQDDPKGILYNRFVRKLLVFLSATGGLAWFGGPFFVWWLSTQYTEKTKALSDLEDLKKEVVLVKTEITALKTFDQVTNINLMRIEDKVDTILLNVEGLGQRLGSRPRTQTSREK